MGQQEDEQTALDSRASSARMEDAMLSVRNVRTSSSPAGDWALGKDPSAGSRSSKCTNPVMIQFATRVS